MSSLPVFPPPPPPSTTLPPATCPLSHIPMDDPVIAADGVTYERAAIEEWLRRGHTTSPLTGRPLRSTDLTPNPAMRRAAQPTTSTSGGGGVSSFLGGLVGVGTGSGRASQRAQSNGARQMIVAAIDRAEAEAVSRAARRGSSASAAPAPFLPDVNTIVSCLEGIVALVDQLGAKDVLRMCAESAGGEGTETCVALIAITNAYRGNKAVANAALAAICRLTARYGDGPDATARRRLGDRGGCEAVTEVLRTHGGDMGIVQRCLECVKYLGREGVNCRRLGDAGACDLVVQAMRSYPRDRGVQLWGCGSVFNLASNTRENKRRLVNLGIAQLLLAAMQAFPRDEEIQENACGAIGNVGDSPGHPELLRAAGVCEQVVLAMRTFPTARRVNLRGVWAVDSLSRDYLPNRDALGNAGACEIVTEALRTFSRDRDLHYWGIGAVKSLASNHSTNKTRLGAAGACEVLVGVLTTQQHDGAVLRAACGAIVALAAKDNPNKERLFAAGAHASLDAIRPRITAEAMAAKRAI